MPVVELEKQGQIAVVTLNRPEKRNAMSPEVIVRLRDAWLEVRDDDAIRVAVLTGAGDRVFCAGADLGKLIPLVTGARQPEDEWDRKWMESRHEGSFLFDRDTVKPVIAAINGDAIAGGMEIVQGTDIRVAVPEARFGLQEVKWAIFPAGLSTVRLAQQMPYARAMEIMLTGELISAEEAHRLGFLNYVVERDRLMAKAMEIAETIAANGPIAVQAIRRSARQCLGRPFDEAAKIERENSAPVFRTRDAVEGPRAFMEKRKPIYEGR